MLKHLRKLRHSHPLSLKTLLAILLASSLFAAIVAATQLYAGFKEELNQLDTRLKDAEPTFLLSLKDALWRLDENLIRYNLESIRQLPYIEQALLETPQGETYGAAGVQPLIHSTLKEYPLQHSTPEGIVPLGTLRLQVDYTSAYDNLQREALLTIALQALKTLFVSILILLILHRLLFRHLLKLSHIAGQITLHNPAEAFSFDRPEPPRPDELDQIRNALNAMRQRFIEDSKRLEQVSIDRRRLGLAADSGTTALLMFSADAEVLYANRQFKQLLNRDNGDPLDQSAVFEVGQKLQPEQGLKAVLALARSRGEWETELFWQHEGATPAWILIRCQRFMDEGEELFIFLAFDTSEQHEARARERHLLEHDALTGLPNRELALSIIDDQLEELHDGSGLAVFSIALHSYTEALESLGVQYADQLVLEVTSMIEEILPNQSMLARTAANELLCSIPLTTEDGRLHIEKLATDLLNVFNTSLWLGDEQINANVHIGITLAPEDGNTGHQLMRQALAALYQAKRDRRRFSFFQPEMSEALTRRLRISTLLKSGQMLEELDVYFQPIVLSDSGKIAGCETLARWHNAELGWISPEEFIAEAERLNLISEIGELIMQRACLRASDWLAERPDFFVSVNVSPLQIADHSFTQVVNNALSLAQLPSRALKLEVTEQLLLSGNDLLQEKLNHLIDQGISLVIDDFGSGYASMNYLCSFNFQALKIDKSFILNMHDDERTHTLVEATINLAHTLGLAVVAEGVETARHVDSLRAMRCELLQGYHFARPMPAEAFSQMLQQERLACESSQPS